MYSFTDTIFDEISLEGLEGITLQTLWVYLGASFKIPQPPPSALQQQIWEFILKEGKNFTFFELPIERPPVKLFNRFERVDADIGVPITLDESCVTRYKFAQISDGKILGSCEHYHERKSIPLAKLQRLTVDDVLQTWGDKFVIVASPEMRMNALIPINVSKPTDLVALHYCILEAIGRSRYNGETTSGTYSLHNFCEKPPLVFYSKNRLQQLKLITTQSFNERSLGTPVVITKTTLVTLVRFHRTHKNRMEIAMGKMFEYLKKSQQDRVIVKEMRNYVLSFEKTRLLKKLCPTAMFRRVFETRAIPLSQLTPAELELTDKKTSKKGAEKERTETFYYLRNPEMKYDDLFVDESAEVEEKMDEIQNEAHSFIDMNPRDELYRALLRHGTRGCSLTDLVAYTCIPFLIVRQLMKAFVNERIVTTYNVHAGRQRVGRFVAMEYSASAKGKSKEPPEKPKELTCSAVPNIPDNLRKLALSDIPEIRADIKPFEYKDKIFKIIKTQRQELRQQKIVKMVDERCIVSVTELRTAIYLDEKEKGHTDEICNKSLQRLLFELTEKKVIRLYQLTLCYEECTRTYRIATHPKIEADDDVLKNEIIRMKTNLYCSYEDRRTRADNKSKEKQRQAAETSDKGQGDKAKVTLATQNNKPPKFLISRHLHELLFYLTAEQPRTQSAIPLTEPLLRTWQRIEPTICATDFNEHMGQDTPNVVAYNSELSWRTFIPPLPTYDDKPEGWLYYPDLLKRMPLSIFNKIFPIDSSQNERIKDILSHPVQQHFLMLQLPVELQCQVNRMQLQRIHSSTIKLLNHMGLVQVSERQKDPMNIWVYVNRKASILDTTSTDPAAKQVTANREYPTLSYTFNKSELVEKYWTTLQRICFCTRLGFYSASKAKVAQRRIYELQYLGTVDFDEAPLIDKGELPGDHLGAGGLNSTLYAHILRSWSWVLHTNVKTKNPRSVYIRAKYHKAIKRKQQSTHIRSLPISVASNGAGGGTKTAGKNKKKMLYVRDAIDREALKNRRTLRVSWSQQEDEVLKMAQVVYQYIAAPVHQLMWCTVGRICRDFMRQLIGNCNKVTLACVRRIKFIEKMRRNRPDVPNWLHMLRTNNYIQNQYGYNFLSRLKTAYPVQTQFSEALEKHFVLLMDYLFRYVHDIKPNLGLVGDGVVAHGRFLLPDTLADYERRFRECPVVEENCLMYATDPGTELDLKLHTVMSVLHSSMCSARDKTLYNLQAFEIYKHYTEDVLHTAFRKATRNAFVIAVKRKNMKMVPTHLSGPAFTLSSRYRMRLYLLRIPYELYDVLHGYFEYALQTFYASQAKDATRVLQLKSPNIGHLFFIAESLHCNYWSVQIKLPFNVIAIDAEQPTNMTSSERTMDHFHTIFENAPVTEYSKIQDNESNEKQVRVKFQRANRCYKLHYNPYDRIAKLPEYQVHFFCALDSFEQQADLKFSRLHVLNEEDGCVEVKCPFKCVLQDADYMQSIERIVVEHRDVLDKLKNEIPPQQLLNLTNSSDLITIQANNLLPLVRMLEAFWGEKVAQHKRKDIGKISDKLKTTKSIDWLDLCQQILACSSDDNDNKCSDGEPLDRGDEYEPVLNKEERIVRAQDACVVSLPTMQFHVSAKLAAETANVKHNKMSVPATLLEMETTTEAILSKVTNESHWMYTEDTLASVLAKITGFNAMELQHVQEIHDHIKAAAYLGVTVIELMTKFPFVKFLLRVLEVLREHYLIKRLGVCNVRYVHKAHVREWLVHSFHIKRLEQESLGGAAEASTLKRKAAMISNDEDTKDEETGSSSKRKRKNSTTIPNRSEGKYNTKSMDVDSTKTSQKIKSKSMSKNKTDNSVATVDTQDEEKPTCSKRIRLKKSSQSDSVTVNRDIIVMQPKPWIRLNGSLNRRVLDKWIGSILLECIANCSCTIPLICNRFPYLPPVDIMFLLELLSDLKCIRLIEMQTEPLSLFSEYKPPTERVVYQLYDPSITYIRVQPDATLRMTRFMGNKKYNVDFI